MPLRTPLPHRLLVLLASSAERAAPLLPPLRRPRRGGRHQPVLDAATRGRERAGSLAKVQVLLPPTRHAAEVPSTTTKATERHIQRSHQLLMLMLLLLLLLKLLYHPQVSRQC